MSGPAPRPGILDIAPYVGGKAALPGVERVIKLSSNESALGPSPRAVAAYEAAAGELRDYPDGGSDDLRKAIGKRYGLDPERIICGNGSDEIITLLTRAYAGPGDEVLYCEHGFAMYPISARTVGAEPVTAGETNLATDVDKLLAAVTPRTRIVFVANPNNPTGSYVSGDELARLRAGLAEHILLVIDAAYAEFVSKNDYSDGQTLVDASVGAGDNVVMTRTFSKIFALAALRLGWGYCPQPVADVLQRLRNPFNVTRPAQLAGIAALDDVAHLDAAREHNDIWLPWFREAVAETGLTAHPSVGNFVLVRFPEEAGKTAEAANAFLNARGIIPRMVANYGLPDCLRITIGTEAEMRATALALKDFMTETSS